MPQNALLLLLSIKPSPDFFSFTQIANRSPSKQLFRVCNRLSARERSPLPTTYPPCQLPDVFCYHFTRKVTDIYSDLDQQTSFSPVVCPDLCLSSVFESFRPVSEQELRSVILRSKPATCSVEPIPTSLFLGCLDDLLPTLTQIVNESLLSGSLPSVFKHAVVRPLLKKPSPDSNNLKNYRPVSNLSFLSKVIEKTVLRQPFAYLNSHDLLCPLQSAYRPCHSTETTLLKITNDILRALDYGDAAVLTLSDLSSAFDTVDHYILLHRL